MAKKYRYTIHIVLVKDIEELQSIMNSFGDKGHRVSKVERTDNSLYEGNKMKYTIYTETKI